MHNSRIRLTLASLFDGALAALAPSWHPPVWLQKLRGKDPDRNPYRYRGSRYVPHQGERECYRRRIGGFHTIKHAAT